MTRARSYPTAEGQARLGALLARLTRGLERGTRLQKRGQSLKFRGSDLRELLRCLLVADKPLSEEEVRSEVPDLDLPKDTRVYSVKRLGEPAGAGCDRPRPPPPACNSPAADQKSGLSCLCAPLSVPPGWLPPAMHSCHDLHMLVRPPPTACLPCRPPCPNRSAWRPPVFAGKAARQLAVPPLKKLHAAPEDLVVVVVAVKGTIHASGEPLQVR